MSRDATWVVNPCTTKFELDMSYRSRVTTTKIFFLLPLEAPNLYFFEGKMGQISNFILLNPKRHFLCVNKVYSRTVLRDVSKNATCGRHEVKKLSCIKLAIWPDHPRRHSPLKFCMRGRLLKLVIYFKFRENRSKGLRAVGGRKSQSPIDLAMVLLRTSL